MSDKRLARKAQRGDRAAFGRLVAAHQDKVFTLALRMTGSRDLAEDLSQAAFMRVWEQLDRYDSNRPFRPWLFRVSANVVRNGLKSLRTDPLQQASRDDGPFPEAAQPDGAAGPEKAAAQAQEAEQLAARLHDLKPKLREAVVLRFYMDLEFEEIAQTLDISLSSAKMRVYRGLDALRGAYFGEDDEHTGW